MLAWVRSWWASARSQSLRDHPSRRRGWGDRRKGSGEHHQQAKHSGGTGVGNHLHRE